MRTDESHLRGWTVSRRIAWRGIVIGAAVVVVAIIAAALVVGTPDSPTADSEEQLTTQVEDGGRSEESTTATSPTVQEAAPLVATNEAGELIPPKSTGKKPAATAAPSTPGTPPAPSTPEEAAYLEQTKKVVETNAGALAAVVEAATKALSDRDEGSLSTMLAGDEADQAAFVETLASRYPPIQSAQLGSNVNVFSAGDTTLYFAYAIVTWTDGGITSQHTIPIVLRLIDGEWRLSTLGETGSDLEFVQSVTL